MSTRTSKFHSRLNVLAFLLLASIVFQQSHSQYRFLENRTPLPMGEDTGFLLDSPTRIKIDLSGEWSYKITGGPAGMVNLPAAADFAGEVTFERSFEVNPDDFGKYQFHVVCLGANYTSAIWINGDFITNHIGGYTSFVAPIPDNVLQIGKENVIRVVTDNRLDVTKTIPIRHGVGGWRNYGGVYRHIYILGTPRIFITDVVASAELTADRSLAKVKVYPSLEGGTRSDTAARRFQMYAEVYEKLSGTLVAGSSQVPVRWAESGWSVPSIECTLPSPKLWDLGSPNLYSVRAYLVDGATKTRIDEYWVTIGIRKLEIAGDRVMLNGVVQPLYGVVWYEDHEAYGSALPATQMEKDIILMKSLGATAVRFAHHPPHPYMIDLCNRYGLLVLEELPVHRVPAYTLSQEHFLELALARLKEMIVRDRNHPCVFAWGLGDGFETTDSLARRFVEPLAAAARRLDSRPLYYGTQVFSGDMCSDLVDFTALTLLSTDPKVFRKKIQEWKIAHPQRLLLLGKVGVEVQPGNENGYSDPLSLQAQARFYFQHLQPAREENVAGIFVWSFNDWKGDRPALTVNSGNPWLHTYGLVSSAREKRIAYDAVRNMFTGGKPLAVPMGKNPVSSPIEFVLAGLVLLIGTAYLYNANRRFRGSLHRAVLNTYNFFSDVRDQRIVTVLHGAFLGFAASAGTTIVLASLLYRFRNSMALDNFLSYILISDDIKATVVHLIREPSMFLLVGTGVLFSTLLLVSVLVWFLSIVFRARLYLYHAFAVTMWSTPPMLVLLPVGMIIYRLLENPVYLAPTVLLTILLMVWTFLRFLKGLSIVMDVYPIKVYAFGILSVVGMLAGLYVYFDYTQSASLYVSEWYNALLRKMR